MWSNWMHELLNVHVLMYRVSLTIGTFCFFHIGSGTCFHNVFLALLDLLILKINRKAGGIEIILLNNRLPLISLTYHVSQYYSGISYKTIFQQVFFLHLQEETACIQNTACLAVTHSASDSDVSSHAFVTHPVLITACPCALQWRAIVQTVCCPQAEIFVMIHASILM